MRLIKNLMVSLAATLDHDPKASEIQVHLLSRRCKFILLAAFLASSNPVKSDLRMFGRGLDEKKRKPRRKTRPGAGNSKKIQIPAEYSGPSPFPLDRLVAMLGVLLEENDPSSDPRLTIPGEATDMEISRIWVYSSVSFNQICSAYCIKLQSIDHRIGTDEIVTSHFSIR